MITVPPPATVTVFPLTDAGPETTEKVIGNPLLAVALIAKGALVVSWSAMAGKVIVRSARLTTTAAIELVVVFPAASLITTA
jgi:hypothetical protein